MIPVQLTLKNFLSYRDATLILVGCILLAFVVPMEPVNFLLEAITWAIW